MMYQTESEIYNAAINFFGVESQLNMLSEEVGELLTAINKWRRYGGCKEYNMVVEEIADVEIMLNQMKVIFDCNNKDIYNKKLERLKGRIEHV